MATHILFLRPPLLLGNFIQYVERDMGHLKGVVVGYKIKKEYETTEDRIAERPLPETDFEKNKQNFNYYLDKVREHVDGFKSVLEKAFDERFEKAFEESERRPKEKVIRIPEEREIADGFSEEDKRKLKKITNDYSGGVDIESLVIDSKKYNEKRRELIRLGYDDPRIQMWYDEINKIGSFYGFHLVEISVPTLEDIFDPEGPAFTYLDDSEAIEKMLGISRENFSQIIDNIWDIASELEEGKEIKGLHDLIKQRTTKRMTEMGIPIWSERYPDEPPRTIIRGMKFFEVAPLSYRILSKLLEEIHGKPVNVQEILDRQFYPLKEIEEDFDFDDEF